MIIIKSSIGLAGLFVLFITLGFLAMMAKHDQTREETIGSVFLISLGIAFTYLIFTFYKIL